MIIGDIWRKIYGKLIQQPTNFSWLIDSKLAGCGMPTSTKEIHWFIQNNIKSIVTMTEKPLPTTWISDLNYMHMPTDDRTAPPMDKIDNVVNFIHNQIIKNEPVVVHCAAGIGRTGTILACYLVKYNKNSAKTAIHNVRIKRPGSIQSLSQEQAVFLYEKYINMQ